MASKLINHEYNVFIGDLFAHQGKIMKFLGVFEHQYSPEFANEGELSLQFMFIGSKIRGIEPIEDDDPEGLNISDEIEYIYDFAFGIIKDYFENSYIPLKDCKGYDKIVKNFEEKIKMIELLDDIE
jgi:hypothetical protein